MRFKVDDGLSGLDIATKNNPYSRQVDCTTRETVTPGQVAITPRPVPVAAVTRGRQDAVGRRVRHLHLPVADDHGVGRHVP